MDTWCQCYLGSSLVARALSVADILDQCCQDNNWALEMVSMLEVFLLLKTVRNEDPGFLDNI